MNDKQIMEEAGKAALKQVQADLSGDILDDIAMMQRVADSLDPEESQWARGRIFMMMLQAGKYAFVTENGGIPPFEYKEYVTRFINDHSSCHKLLVHGCFSLIDIASKGDIAALMQLGKNFYGTAYCEVDWPFSAFCYEMAAENGNEEAKEIIAMMYESGIGVPQSDERARYWRNK